MRVQPLQGASINGQMKPTFIALLALCLCLGGCGKKAAPEPEQAKVPSKPAVQDSKTGQPKAEAKKPGTPIWGKTLKDSAYGSAAVGTDGTVYFCMPPWIYAVSGKNGSTKWKFDAGAHNGRLNGAIVENDSGTVPVIGQNGLVYVVGKSLYALDAVTGEKKWSFKGVFDSGFTPAIGIGGGVYVTSLGKSYFDHSKNKWINDQTLHALDGKTGRLKWEFKTQGGGVSAIGPDGTLYVSGLQEEKRCLYALDGRSGAKIWAMEIDTSTSPAIDTDGTLYLGVSGHGPKEVVVKEWTEESGGKAATLTQKKLTWVTDPKIVALDGKTGDMKWEFATLGQIHSSPVIGLNGTIICGTLGQLYVNDINLYALDSKTGRKKWSTSASGHIYSPLSIGDDGVIYAISSENFNAKACAFDGKTGVKKWVFDLGYETMGSPAIGPDGTLYVGIRGKELTPGDFVPSSRLSRWDIKPKFFAIKTSSTGLAKSPWPALGQNAQHVGRALKK